MKTLNYDTPVTLLDGTQTDLRSHEGRVLLIVNTASQCGLTPQYAGLEALWREFEGRGLTVLGFPCNQFGAQEPGGSEQIASFCQLNYGVSFPMHAKIKVNGTDTHALFVQLKGAAPGLLGSSKVKWNFTKFLVDRKGQIVRRFAPQVQPDEIRDAIEALLE